LLNRCNLITIKLEKRFESIPWADLKQIGDDYGFDATDCRIKRAQNADDRHGRGLRKAGDRV